LARALAVTLIGALLWWCGPQQVSQAAAARWADALQARAGKARRLSAAERRSGRGRACWPGAPRAWRRGVPALGGYGTVNVVSRNQKVTILVVEWGGKGVPTAFALTHNSASTGSGAQAPISSGWTHSYHVYLLGAGTTSVTVVSGDGSQDVFTQNL